MEPPVRRPDASRRDSAADRSRLAPAALLPALLLLAASCGDAPGPTRDAAPSQGPELSLADAATLPPGEEGDFDDLPGIEGFLDLSPALQDDVVARANRTRCDCGCPNHSVNHCLHQDEDCEVALRLARGFVDDASSLQLQAGDAASAAPADPPEEPEPADATGDEPPAVDEAG